MAAQPVHNQSPHAADKPEAANPTGVQAVESHDSVKHVASPAHALQARIAAELTKPSRMSARRIAATILVLCLSTWLAGFILYATF
jgi:hypothetical protein